MDTWRKWAASTAASMVLLLVVSFASHVLAQDGERIELTFWHHWSGDRVELVQKMLDDFMAAHPNIYVEQIYAPISGAVDQLVTFVLGGAAPEIAMYRTTDATGLIAKGVFLPLDELIERDGIDLSMFIPGDVESFRVNGKTYALPGMSGAAWTNLMFVNRALLNQAGLDPDSPPKTWSEFLQVVKILTKTDGEGNVIHAGSEIPNVLYVAGWTGAQLWSDDWRTAMMNNPRVFDAFDFTMELISTQFGTRAAANAFQRPSRAFLRGVEAFNFRNNAQFDNLVRERLVEDWGATLAPTIEAGVEPLSFNVSTWAYGITSSTPPEKREAAWLLLKWLTLEEEAGGWFARIQGRPSPVIHFNHHPDYMVNPYWYVVIEAAMREIVNPPIDVTPIHDLFNQGLNGKTTPVETVENVQRELQLQLDAYWHMIQGEL